MMVITIDGPAGAGKSSISRQFASKINYKVLDTGAMYRSIALLLVESQLSIDSPEFQALVEDVDIQFQDSKVILNGRNVSTEIRSAEIDFITSTSVSRMLYIRKKMLELQRQIASSGDIVAEGRDMGSVVFPNAELKFYLVANSTVRAKRRQKQLQKNNISVDLESLEKQIQVRDTEDSNRECNPLCIPDGAIVVDSSFLTQNQVLSTLITFYEQITI